MPAQSTLLSETAHRILRSKMHLSLATIFRQTLRKWRVTGNINDSNDIMIGASEKMKDTKIGPVYRLGLGTKRSIQI